MNVSFYCRESKKDRNGLSPIEMSIVLNGQRTYIQTGLRITPKQYAIDVKSKRANQTKEHIDIARSRAYTTLHLIQMDGKPITIQMFKDYYTSGGRPIYTLEMCYADYTKANMLNEESKKKYDLVMRDMTQIVTPNTDINNVTNKDIISVFTYLKANYKPSTANSKMAKVKSIIQFAIDNNKMQSNPLVGIKIHKWKSPEEYLTDEELNALYTYHPTCERIQRTLDLAIVQCNTGLSYADLANLHKEDVMTKNGTMYIHKPRQKTGIYFTAVLLPKAIEILEKYDWQLPMLSNQKYNAYSKEIADICGIQKRLHSHLYRKTYATLLLAHNVPMTIISKCLGHSNTTITESIYAHTQLDNILNEVSKAVQS